MNKSIAVLGRQPKIGLAELESVCGADSIISIGSNIALIDAEPSNINFIRLGGTIKLAELLDVIPTRSWNEVAQHLINSIEKYIRSAEGKVTVGLSAYNFGNLNPQVINALALSLKKSIQQSGRSCRIVPNNSNEISSAQILHNKLTDENGCELLIIRDVKQTYVARTSAVQDIEAYAARDQARPKRDARVGMLPPKLAQIIINLAKPSDGVTVLDPFCGTGVVLQEAALAGYSVYGSDIDERMVEYTKVNMDWLEQQTSRKINALVEQADATEHTWTQFGTIAAETYLGRPFSTLPDNQTLDKVIQDVDTIHKKFLSNLARQTEPEFRLCIAVPAWKTTSGFKHLPVIEKLASLGYTLLSFVHAKQTDLIYHREEQVVGRELLVLIRK